MAGKCNRPDCYPDETGCNVEGHAVLSDCPYYGKHNVGPSEEPPNTEKTDTDLHVAWTGNTLGLQDLAYLSMTTKKLIVIGITGVASAGKTTFLATLYCLLRNGYSIGDYIFGGSITLLGWENIAWYLTWKSNNSIQFPPHTTINSGRVPGLLHLALVNPEGQKVDLVFTDAPGEWFDKWSFNQHDENAKGAVWIHDYADAFLLFADCEMLSGKEMGKARKQTRLVADRLKQELASRPLGLVWSKSDVALAKDIKDQITEYINNSPIIHYQEFETSSIPAEDGRFHKNVCQSIAWILGTIQRQTNALLTVPTAKPDDMFLSIR
jgi:hypothetical protein